MNQNDHITPHLNEAPAPYVDIENVTWLLSQEERIKEISSRKAALFDQTTDTDIWELASKWSCLATTVIGIASESLQRLWDAEDRAERALGLLDSRTRTLLSTMSKNESKLHWYRKHGSQSLPDSGPEPPPQHHLHHHHPPESERDNSLELEKRNKTLKKECHDARRRLARLTHQTEADKQTIQCLRDQNAELCRQLAEANEDFGSPTKLLPETHSSRPILVGKDRGRPEISHPVKFAENVAQPCSENGLRREASFHHIRLGGLHTSKSQDSIHADEQHTPKPTTAHLQQQQQCGGGDYHLPPIDVPRLDLKPIHSKPAFSTRIGETGFSANRNSTEQDDVAFHKSRAIANFQVIVRKVQLMNAQERLARASSLDPFISFFKRMEERNKVLLEKWQKRREILLAERERHLAALVKFNSAMISEHMSFSSATPSFRTSFSSHSLLRPSQNKTQPSTSGLSRCRSMTHPSSNRIDIAPSPPSSSPNEKPHFSRKKSIVAIQNIPNLLIAGQSGGNAEY